MRLDHSSEPGCEQYTNADHGAGSSVGRPGCAGAGMRCIECPAVPQNTVVIVILDVVVVDSQEVVVLQLVTFEVGFDEFQADLDGDTADHQRRQNFQRLANGTQSFYLPTMKKIKHRQ